MLKLVNNTELYFFGLGLGNIFFLLKHVLEISYFLKWCHFPDFLSKKYTIKVC